MIYLGETNPMTSLLDQRMEYFNEFAIMATIYTLPLFTDYVPELETRYSIGWVSILIALIQILGNMGVVFFTCARRLVQWCKQKYRELFNKPEEVEISATPQQTNQAEV